MDLNSFDIKILKYISKQKSPVKNQKLLHKFGGESENVTRSLFDCGYLKCPDFVSKEQLGFVTSDDWEITENGRNILKSYLIKEKFEKRKAIKHELIGYIFGVLTGISIQFFPDMIKWILKNILK